MSKSRSLAVTGVPSDHRSLFLSVIDTVRSPWLYTGGFARLSAAFTSGVTPFTVQYVGRHICSVNRVVLATALSATGMTGKIQFGVWLAHSATAIVPAVSGPAAAGGTDPIDPGTEPVPLAMAVPAAAARNPAAATAAATSTRRLPMDAPRLP